MKCPYCGGETTARKCEYCNSDLSEYYVNNGTLGGTVSGIISNMGQSIANSIGGNNNPPSNTPNINTGISQNTTNVTQNIIVGQSVDFQNNNLNAHMMQMNANVNMTVESRKSKVLAIILCIIGFFGLGGLHRLYTGKYVSGIIWLFTGGLFYIGTIVDLILLLTGKFYDKDDKPLLR